MKKPIMLLLVVLLVCMLLLSSLGYAWQKPTKLLRPFWFRDTHPPISSISPEPGTYTSAQTITITAFDLRDRNPYIYYQISTGSYYLYTAPFTISEDSTINYYAADHAGNTESLHTAVYTFEEEPEFEPSDYTILAVTTDASSSDTNLASLFEDLGYNVDTSISIEDLESGEEMPVDIDVIVYPGGIDAVYSGMNANVQSTIREFVNAGGDFIAVCGGAIAALDTLYYEGAYPISMIGLLDLDGVAYNSWYSTYVGSPIDVELDFSEHEITNGYAEDSISYAGGPAFTSIGLGVTSIATYASGTTLSGIDVSGDGAIGAGTYGDGEVVLFAVHPELDSSTEYLLENAMMWVLGR